MNSPDITPQPIAVSPTQAAEMLSLCRATIYNLMASGQLRSTKIGRSRRLLVSDLQQLLEDNFETPESLTDEDGIIEWGEE